MCSFAYLRSPICKTEFAVLRETRGKILAAIHSDVARSADGIALMAELEAEGHRIWIVRVAEARDVGVIAASFNLCYNGMLRPMLRVCGRGANGGSKAESFVFHIGGRWVGTIEFLWLVLCAGDVLLDVFKIRSPPMNAAGCVDNTHTHTYLAITPSRAAAAQRQTQTHFGVSMHDDD
jgi:hypothetical protein